MRQSLILLFFAVSALIGLAEPAWAQSCGGSLGPSPSCGPSSQDGSWLSAGQGVARLSSEYEVKDRSYQGHDRVENDFDESVFISRTALDLRYGLTDDWTVNLTATYPHVTYRLKPPGGERVVRTFRGPGDTFLAFGRRLTGAMDPHAAMDEPGFMALPDEPPPERGPTVSLWAGVSIPTGSAEEPNPEIVTRDVSVSNLQTGTGTFDPFVRAQVAWDRGSYGLFAQAEVRVPLYENRYDYRTADTETLVVGVHAPIVPRLSASLAAIWQRVGRDEFRGDDVGVGGATWVYVAPTLAFQVADGVALDVGVRIPVYRRTDTKLSDSPAVFQAGLTLSF